MAPQLRALAALEQDQSSVLSTHAGLQRPATPAPWNLMAPLGLTGIRHCTQTHIHVHTRN